MTPPAAKAASRTSSRRSTSPRCRRCRRAPARCPRTASSTCSSGIWRAPGQPVLLDAHFFEGDVSTLRRTPSPPPERLQDEYLVDLAPQAVAFLPATSLPVHRRDFRTTVDALPPVHGQDGWERRYALELALQHEGQIGQLLGYANAGDERDNLYREVHLARIGRRELVDNDYWDSLADYEADIEDWRARGHAGRGFLGSLRRMLSRRARFCAHIADSHEAMRPGVLWLTENSHAIAQGAAAWRLLLRLDSNLAMNLLINDADPLYVFIRHEDLARRDFSDLAGEVTQG